MQIKKIRVNGRDNIVKLAAWIGLGAFVAQIFAWRAVVSVLFACSFVCVTANYLVFISARKRVRLDDIALFLLTLLVVLLSEWKLQFDYFKPAIIVLCSALCIDQCIEIRTGRKTCKRIQWLLILLCIVVNTLYYYGGFRSYYYGSTSFISLNMGNSNETAMWLVFLIVLLWDSASMEQEIGAKIRPMICAVTLLPILFGTGSRNCLIAIVFFFAGRLCLWLFKIRKLPNGVIFLIMMAPILVYVGYMYIFIPHYERLSHWFLFLAAEGKPLTARSRIWSDLEISQLKHILFGNYTEYHGQNLHNSMVTIFCGYGALYVFILCKKFYKAMLSTQNAAVQLTLGTVWLTGCFEASIFAGVAGMYMLVLLLPIFHQPAIHRTKRC